MKELIEALRSGVDTYQRKARLYPAGLVMLPVIWTSLVLFPALSEHKPLTVTCSIVFALGGAYWFAGVARDRGKELEGVLVREWGGLSTTRMLRHADGTYDPFTKARFHTQLQQMCGLPMPTVTDEVQEPLFADQKYSSAIVRLRERTREPKYRSVHRENAEYGFRRNLLGMKWIGSAVAAGMIVLMMSVLVYGLHGAAVSWAVLARDAAARPAFYAVLALNTASLWGWLCVVKRGYVRRAADAYAVALLQTLEG